MTTHYHGTPITPIAALQQIAGRHFCVSFAAPADVARVHQIGQSVMLDNGAFSVWRRGLVADWPAYYAWSDIWLDYPTTWAVIPDVIDGDAEQQDALITQWPHGERGAPVWHMHEPVERLMRLSWEWPLVCIGSMRRLCLGLVAPVAGPDGRGVERSAASAHAHAPRPHASRHAVRAPRLALLLGRQHRHRPEPQPAPEHPARHGRSLGRPAVPGDVGPATRAAGHFSMTTRADAGPHEARFDITRTDGQPIEPSRRYFVLDFSGADPEAVQALQRYAALKAPTNPALAETLSRHLADPVGAPAQHRWAR